jgi:hypothetical protein
MTADFGYDPVTAIDEAKAVGEAAALFAEIRQTMRIPLVTSIWLGLAGMDDSLRPAWVAAKPIYESGEPEQALTRSVAAVGLPRPEPLAPTALTCVGLAEGDVVAVRAVIAAYNRSNGLNLMALAALIGPSPTDPITTLAVGTVISPPHWPKLAPPLPREAIRADTWDLIRHVNAFGAPGVNAGVATLCRQLAHWPALLAVVHGAFASLQSRGQIDQANARLVALAAAEGACWRICVCLRRGCLAKRSTRSPATSEVPARWSAWSRSDMPRRSGRGDCIMASRHFARLFATSVAPRSIGLYCPDWADARIRGSFPARRAACL